MEYLLKQYIHDILCHTESLVQKCIRKVPYHDKTEVPIHLYFDHKKLWKKCKFNNLTKEQFEDGVKNSWFGKYPIWFHASFLAANGQLQVLKIAEDKLKFHAYVMNHAIQYNHFDVVEWLHEHRTEGCTRVAFVFAAARNDIYSMSSLQWLQKNKPDVTPCINSIIFAAWFGRIDIIKWLFSNYKINDDGSWQAIAMAAKNGYFEIAKWLCINHPSHNCIDNMVINYAACSGNLKMIVWLYNNFSKEMSWHAIINAAKNGHLDTIVWLYNHGCKCSSEAIIQAAYHGHLDIVKWIYKNSDLHCVSKDAIEYARSRGCHSIIRWLDYERPIRYIDKEEIDDWAQINWQYCEDHHLSSSMPSYDGYNFYNLDDLLFNIPKKEELKSKYMHHQCYTVGFIEHLIDSGDRLDFNKY